MAKDDQVDCLCQLNERTGLAGGEEVPFAAEAVKPQFGPDVLFHGIRTLGLGRYLRDDGGVRIDTRTQYSGDADHAGGGDHRGPGYARADECAALLWHDVAGVEMCLVCLREIDCQLQAALVDSGRIDAEQDVSDCHSRLHCRSGLDTRGKRLFSLAVPGPNRYSAKSPRSSLLSTLP